MFSRSGDQRNGLLRPTFIYLVVNTYISHWEVMSNDQELFADHLLYVCLPCSGPITDLIIFLSSKTLFMPT